MTVEPPIPETRYAESDGLSIAYQVFGSGATDLVMLPPIFSHVEEGWRLPTQAAMLRRLGEHFRVIIFDKRSQGLSGPLRGARRSSSAWTT